MTTDPSGHVYEFGPFRLDPAERLLLRQNVPVTLTPKVFDILLMFVRNSGRALGKEAFMREIWPDSFVEEGSLNRNVSTLRKALGDGEGGHRFIETLPKLGYRFVAEVREVGGPAPARSIAVLPFKAMAGQESDEHYLGLGMADAIIVKLSNLSQINVRPTGAVLKYTDAGQDIVTTGRELRVEALLDGRVQQAGDRVRVTVQFVSIPDGALIWAGTFDEKFTDIFAVQDSISEQVARALTLKLSGAERQSLTKHYTENGAAYQSYLKGRYYWNKMTSEGLRRSLECFADAVGKDPRYALAYAGMAASYVHMEIYGFVLPSEAMPRARAAALKAIELDATVAEAHASLALVRMFYERDWPEAEKEFRQALRLNPSYAAAHDWFAIYLMSKGRTQEALASIRKAQELDPLSLVINTDVACALYYARRFDESIDQCRWVLETEPNFVTAHFRIGLAYEQLGRYAEAAEAFRSAIALSADGSKAEAMAAFKGGSDARASLAHTYALAGDYEGARGILADLEEQATRAYVPPHDIAMIYSALGETDKAFDWLRRAYRERFSLLVLLELDPRFDNLRAARTGQA
ncbi:MAG TPA: tetratricopeptide repeat protein [Pyrinomonadaceae bacterium]|jgi:TolB-like protein/Tfp pilus assembly protein PilF|nr:tetratricopeptide repeat protein [Pyrinomonadaceae bacterium]